PAAGLDPAPPDPAPADPRFRRRGYPRAAHDPPPGRPDWALSSHVPGTAPTNGRWPAAARERRPAALAARVAHESRQSAPPAHPVNTPEGPAPYCPRAPGHRPPWQRAHNPGSG